MQICGHPLCHSSDFLSKQHTKFSTADKVQLIFAALVLSGTLITLCALLSQPQGISPIGTIGLTQGAVLGLGLLATSCCPLSKEEKRIRHLKALLPQAEETLILETQEEVRERSDPLESLIQFVENPVSTEEESVPISKADQQLPQNRPILHALNRCPSLRQAPEFKRFLSDRIDPQKSLSEKEIKRIRSITSEVYRFLVALIPTCGSHYPNNFIENALKEIFSVTDELEFEKNLASLSLIPFFIEVLKSIKTEPESRKKEIFILLQSLIEAEEDKLTWVYLCQMEFHPFFDLLITTLNPLSQFYHEDNQVIFNLIRSYITLLAPIYCEKEIALQKKRLENLEKGLAEQEALEKFREELTELNPPKPLKTNLTRILGHCEIRLHDQHLKQLGRTKNYLAQLQIFRAVLPYVLQTIFFSPSPNIIRSYLEYVKDPNRKEFLLPDPSSSRPLLPEYQEYAAFTHLIEKVVLNYRTIAPAVKNRFFEIINPREPSSVTLRGNFKEKVSQLQDEFRIVKDELDRAPQEDLIPLSNRAKTLASLFFDTVSIRLTEQPYGLFIQDVISGSSSLMAHLQEELPPKESLSSFLKKSFLIHQSLWKTPHLHTPADFVESWISFFQHPMERMKINTQALVHAVHEGTEIAFAWSSSIDEQSQEALRLVPFFESIPLLLSFFFSASFLDKVRPFLSQHASVPITFLTDIQLLFGSLMEEEGIALLENYKGPTNVAIKTVLGILAPLNGLVMSDLPGKSTLLNKIIHKAINEFVPQLCSETLTCCFDEFLFPSPSIPLKSDEQKLLQRLIWRMICNAKKSNADYPVLSPNDTQWWEEHCNEILSTNSQEILKPDWAKMLNREFPIILKRKFEAWARLQNITLSRLPLAQEALASAWTSFSEGKTPIQLIHCLVSFDQIWKERIYSPLFKKLKLIESVEPFILFLAYGILGSASDRQIFSEIQIRLQQFYHRLYAFNLERAESQPDTLVTHTSEAFTGFFQTHRL